MFQALGLSGLSSGPVDGDYVGHMSAAISGEAAWADTRSLRQSRSEVHSPATVFAVREFQHEIAISDILSHQLYNSLCGERQRLCVNWEMRLVPVAGAATSAAQFRKFQQRLDTCPTLRHHLKPSLPSRPDRSCRACGQSWRPRRHQRHWKRLCWSDWERSDSRKWSKRKKLSMPLSHVGTDSEGSSSQGPFVLA